jgi:N-acetyl-alpha-D-muramate 1-phosphate uridylyltransferase
VTGPELAGVALAAGRGERLRPLTDLRPKPLCPIANRPLVDLALDRLTAQTGSGPDHLAVNAHYLSDLLAAHVGDRATLSFEQPVALGTAGALGALRPWIAGRPVLLTNTDAYLPEGLDELVAGWDGQRIRLLCRDIGQPSDFGTLRYVGGCIMPWAAVATLVAVPSGLYELVWRGAEERGELDLVVSEAVAIDCGRPAAYLAANLHASGGRSVIGAGAVVEGRLERSVVWPDAYVGPDEELVEAIRAGTRERPVTLGTGGRTPPPWAG